MARTGAQILVDMLVINGVRHAFGVPGESYLAVLDALHDSPVKFTICRQEGGAAMMADAAGKLTGQPGICFVTRGPGATNAAAGVHIAMQDSTPMILFVGQVERGFQDREAFQEVDYAAAFGPWAKWAAEIRDASRMPEYINRAFAIATSGRPGPVVLALPEDMLTDLVENPQIVPYTPVVPAIGQEDTMKLAALLAGAKAPLVLLGGSGWNAAARADMEAFAAKWQVPVAVSFRRQSLFDHTHPCFAGHLGIGPDASLVARIKAADVLLVIGGRLSEMPSQSYGLLDIPNPAQTLIHVHAGPEEIGKVYRPALGIVSAPPAIAAALAALPAPQKGYDAADAHAGYLAFSGAEVTTPGEVQMRAVMAALARHLPADAAISNGAGNYASWIHRFHRFRAPASQLAPTSGSMGYGLPAAVAAKTLAPSRVAVAFAGDGCFMMTCQELATAVQHDLPVIVIVVDNGIYGTIRMHQEREFPARISGTTLKNPDFAAMARSFGALGLSVETTDAFEPALVEALAAGRPSLIHVKIDPEAITPTTTLSAIRKTAQEKTAQNRG